MTKPKRGRPAKPLCASRAPVTDDPHPIPTAPTAGAHPPIFEPTPEPNPNRCWFWAGPLYLNMNPPRTASYRSLKTLETRGGRYKPSPCLVVNRISCAPHGRIEPHHYLHLLHCPDEPIPPIWGPCRHNGHYAPWPITAARMVLRCINPFHRIHLDPFQVDPVHLKDIRRAQSFREPDDFLRDAEPHFRAIDPPCIETLLSTPLHHPDDPPYTREEIISFLRSTAASLDLPARWRDALHRQLPEQSSCP